MIFLFLFNSVLFLSPLYRTTLKNPSSFVGQFLTKKFSDMKNVVLGLVAVLVASTSVFAATNASGNVNVGLQVVGGVVLLVASIIVPAFKVNDSKGN